MSLDRRNVPTAPRWVGNPVEEGGNGLDRIFRDSTLFTRLWVFFPKPGSDRQTSVEEFQARVRSIARALEEAPPHRSRTD